MKAGGKWASRSASNICQRIALVVRGLACAALAACSAACGGTVSSIPTPVIVREVILDYGIMPYEQIIDSADAIFYGEVLAVTPTRWNQDSGAYWEGALPVFTFDVRILQPLVAATLPDQVTVTQVGYSPLEFGESGSPAAGQQAVLFLVQTAVAWREGPLDVWRTANTIQDSLWYVNVGGTASAVETANQLNEILADISQRRATLEPAGSLTPAAPK